MLSQTRTINRTNSVGRSNYGNNSMARTINMDAFKSHSSLKMNSLILDDFDIIGSEGSIIGDKIAKLDDI